VLDFLESLISPLYYAVSAVLMGWHWLFDLVMPADSGWTWALSIIGLTITTRALLIPLFVKQIKSSRNMQMLQPKVKDLQKKYGHDRERLAQETMALYKDAGTNPFASCLPILMQAPIFFALFRVISEAAGDTRPLGILTQADAVSLEEAKLFSGVRIADTFLGADSISVRVVTLALVAIMTATTFTTQRQLMRKNMPESALTGPYAQQQKMLLYVLPVVFAVGGIAFPIGVLLYWSTSNLWTMGQQFYVIRNNPAPGTPAFEAKRQRDIKHGRIVEPEPEQPTKKTTEPPRRQPKKTSRSKRRRKPQPGPRQKKPGNPPDPTPT
jgi:YidC/Oxa1 family membrane protein insertase